MGLVRARSLVSASLPVPAGTLLLATVPADRRWKVSEVCLGKEAAGAATVELVYVRAAVGRVWSLRTMPTAPGELVAIRETVFEPLDELHVIWTTLAAVGVTISGYELLLP